MYWSPAAWKTLPLWLALIVTVVAGMRVSGRGLPWGRRSWTAAAQRAGRFLWPAEATGTFGGRCLRGVLRRCWGRCRGSSTTLFRTVNDRVVLVLDRYNSLRGTRLLGLVNYKDGAGYDE
jgi:hypothetical protein